jgi:hypothetical protein
MIKLNCILKLIFNMLRYITIGLILVLNVCATKAIELSENAEIRVVTIGPTQTELYSAFGHSGFRVLDSANRIDIFFNYGVFDFNQPNFYLNFTRGKLLYRLGLSDYSRVKDYYILNNRSVTEQVLNLSLEERESVFDFLMENNKPENQEYYYNYIYDNCATKMRDVLQQSLKSELVFDFGYVKEALSYRDLMDLYLKYQPWGDLGIDLCLGAEIDNIADGNGYLYLPDYIELAFAKAKLSANGIEKPLVANTERTYVSSPENLENDFLTPTTVFVIVFFVIGLIIHRSLKYNAANRWLDIILYGITGIVGTLLTILWFATDHLSAYNLNIIWAMPFNILGLFYLLKKKKTNFTKQYFLAYGIIQIALILFSGLLPQTLHLAFVPLVLGLAMRSFYLYFELKNKSITH